MQLLWENGTPLPWHTQKAVCVGRNYIAHAKELNNPLPSTPFFFIKPSTSLVPFENEWPYPEHLGPVHYELELALVIGKRIDHQSSDLALMDAVIGQALALDLTLRETQNDLKAKGLPWEQAKAFDRACPVSVVQPISQIPSEHNPIEFFLTIDQESRQHGHSDNMIFSCLALLKAAAATFTLMPGDILLTGTPEGVGKLQKKQGIQASLKPSDAQLAPLHVQMQII